jgi:cytochrome b
MGTVAPPRRGSPGGVGAGPAPRRVRAWDGPTRLFKWSLVLLVLTAWLTQQRGDAGMPWHVWNGYAILILLVFRLLWGCVGSSTARFSAWLVWPWTALRYGRDLLRGRRRPYLSHNPLGAWMILILLALASLQGVTGLFTVDQNGLVGGPFANLDFGDPTPVQRLFSRWHRVVFYVLVGFAILHVLVNLWYQVVERDGLVASMVTGRKPALDYVDQPEMRPASATWLRAVLCLGAAAGIVLGAVKLGGGGLPF